MDSLDFVERAGKAKVQPVYVLHGDDSFLKRQALTALRLAVLGPDDDGFALSRHTGDRATFAAVRDELDTLPFLSARRLVVIDGADPFVTRERARLEKYLAGPSATGVLVLDVQSWPANTRLAKLLPDAGSIACKAPPSARLPDWCVKWCTARHGKQIPLTAARLLVDLVGSDMGLLDQELGKLAVYAGEAGRIEAADVDRLVGNSRAENTFKIFDLIGSGQSAPALVLLNRLLDQGEEPLKLLGAFGWHLRRLAQTARVVELGTGVGDALERAGVPPFARRQAEQHLRHLGRRRLDQLYDWLLETDLGLKGSSQLPPRLLLERLVVRLARARG